MILGPLTHPAVLSALANAGHTSKVLIVDAHFPAPKLLGRDVEVVHLNYAPGMLGVEDVLKPLVETVPIESAVAAVYEDGSQPDIWRVYEEVLPENVTLSAVKGSALTTAFTDAELAVVIVTGELAPASCIVLSLGIRRV